MKMASIVAESIPPRTVQPIVDLACAPAPSANANGDTPKMNANDVMRIGRKRSFTSNTYSCNQ